MKKALLLSVYLAGSFLVAGCAGTSPEPDYYELGPVAGTQDPALAVSIKVQQPTLADYLDRPDIVQQELDYEYKVDEFQRWAEPLDRMYERVLAEDLRQRLPASVIVTEADSGETVGQYVVETDIQRFNSTDEKSASLKAVLSIKDGPGVSGSKPEPVDLSVPDGGSLQHMAEALSDLIGLYADQVAHSLRQSNPQSAGQPASLTRPN